MDVSYECVEEHKFLKHLLVHFQCVDEVVACLLQKRSSSLRMPNYTIVVDLVEIIGGEIGGS